MKKFVNKYAALLIFAILFVIWNILVWTLADLEKAKVFFYCAYGFTFLSFVLVGCALAFIKINKNTILSVLVPAYIASALYFAVALIMNVIYMCFPDKEYALAIVLPNIILVLIYVAAMIVAFKATSHISGNNKVVQEKVAKLKLTGIEIAQIATIAKDEEVKKALMSLKESVDYSDPIGVDGTAGLEEEFSKKVAELRMLTEGGYEKDLILNKVDAAKNKLNERNQTLKALK